MKTAFIQTAIGIALALAIFFGGMAFAYVGLRLGVEPGDAATWTGAALTGMAFAGTIWLAIAGERKRTQQAWLRAHIAGASLYHEVVTLREEIGTTCGILTCYSQMDRGAGVLQVAAERIANLRLWKQDRLERLLDFEPALVAILVNVEQGVLSTMHSFAKYNGYDDLNSRVLYATTTAEMIKKILDALDYAAEYLTKYHLESDQLRAVHAAS